MITDEMLERDRLLRQSQFESKNTHKVKALQNQIEHLEYNLKAWSKRDEATLFDFERVEIAALQANIQKLRNDLSKILPQSQTTVTDPFHDVLKKGLEKDTANTALQNNTEVDSTQENYGVFDTSPQRPSEIVVTVPMGRLPPVEVFFNPLSRTTRPIPKT